MIQNIYRNWSILALIILSGIVINNNVNSQETNQKFGSNAPTMTFLYCYSCGYRKAFEEYEQIILQKYPDIKVIGANYEPSGINLLLSKMLVVSKYILMAIVGSSFELFAYLGIATPMFWTWALENKLFAIMMIFFFGNMLEAQLISSGAFEISLNDLPIWSKLSSGRIPSPQELFSIIESHLQFTDNFLEKNPEFVK